MKTEDQIRSDIEKCEYFINAHKKQIEFLINDNFDIDEIINHSNKVSLLESKIDTLKWVLNESF